MGAVEHALGPDAEDVTFTVLGAVAELERSLIAERVKAGLRNARAKGRKLGRPRVRRGRRQDCRSARSGALVAQGLRRDGPGSSGYPRKHSRQLEMLFKPL